MAQCAGTHVLDEAERSLHDALCVLSQTVQDARVVYGGGFPEMQMAKVRCQYAAFLFSRDGPAPLQPSPLALNSCKTCGNGGVHLPAGGLAC